MNLIPNRKITGKIASLPSDVRDWINHALHEGLSYPQIISELVDRGYPGFNKNNLVRWRRSGYEHWLAELDRLQSVRIRSETAIEAVKNLKPREKHKLNDLNELLVADQLSKTLSEFRDLGVALNKRPENFFRIARLLNQDAAQHLKRQRFELERVELEQRSGDEI